MNATIHKQLFDAIVHQRPVALVLDDERIIGTVEDVDDREDDERALNAAGWPGLSRYDAPLPPLAVVRVRGGLIELIDVRRIRRVEAVRGSR